MNSKKRDWAITTIYGNLVLSLAKRSNVNAPPFAGTVKCLTFAWRSLRRRSASPISSRISIAEACSVSPRKSRSKSLCASSSVTSTPCRASRRASIAPAGPPPTTQQVVSWIPSSIRSRSWADGLTSTSRSSSSSPVEPHRDHLTRVDLALFSPFLLWQVTASQEEDHERRDEHSRRRLQRQVLPELPIIDAGGEVAGEQFGALPDQRLPRRAHL